MPILIQLIKSSNNIETESFSDQNFKRIVKKESIDCVEKNKKM